MRPKRKAAEMAETKIKCVLDWEGCSERSEMWKQVETKFNEEYEGRIVSDDDLGEEIGDFDCENSSDSGEESLASDDSLNDFVVNSSEDVSAQESSSEEEESFIDSDYSTSEDELEMHDLVNDDEVQVKSNVRHKTEIFDEV